MRNRKEITQDEAGLIVRNVLNAKDRKAQVKIEAQLHDTSEDVVKELLRADGNDLRSLLNGGSRKKKQPAPEPAPDTDKALLQLFNRVNELTAQRDAIVKELCEIKTQIIMINKAIDGEEA